MDAQQLSKEQYKLILEIREDFYRYAENNLWIKDKDAQLVRFVPNQAQKELIDRALLRLKEGKPIRFIVLKARQMGLSTAIEALIYWWTTTHQNITSMIVGHEEQSSRNLYNMFKRYYDNCNPIFKPTRKYDTRSDISFAKEDPVTKEQTGLNSVIKTATANNTAIGRSDTIQILHGSEIGEWVNGEELVASLLQTVPARPNTMIFLESTAKGRGNFFHKQWEESVKGETVFEPFFFPWYKMDEYEMEGTITEYNEEEQEILLLMEEDGIPKERWEAKILFRRYKEREFRVTPERLYQEYPSTAHEAFIATGRPVFDVKMLARMEKRCKPGIKYDLHEPRPDQLRLTLADDLSPLTIWEDAIPGETYVIGADVAEGVKGGDFSVADVIRVRGMQTVAKWRGKCDPDQFGNIIDKLGRHYNYALVGVEINNHGLTTNQRLRDLFYTNLYKREKGIDEDFEEYTAKMGWKTTIVTKPIAIDYLGEAIREGLVHDEDIAFITEAFSYVRDDNGRTNAEIGSHDDTVMAKAIALQLFDWSQNNISRLQVYTPQKVVATKKRNKMVK